MKKMMFGMMLAVFCGLAGTNLFAQEKVDEAKMKQLQRMADAMNLEEALLSKFSEAMEEGMGDEQSGMLPDGFSEMFMVKMAEKFNAEDFLREVIAPVADEYFTLEEITMIADFVESDLGQGLITAKMNGEDFDFEEQLKSGDVAEEDAMKAMQIFVRLGARKDDFADVGQQIETRAQRYGERIAMETISEMMEESMEAETE